MAEKLKQVIVVRTDLDMGKGKLAVQVAHAAVMGAELVRGKKPRWYKEWKEEGSTKVAVKVSSLEELLEIKAKANESNLPAVVVQDRGLTQLPSGTITCIAIGPAPSDKVDQITSKLKLL